MSKQVRPVRLAAAFALILGLALALPVALQAQPLPTPKDFVSNLDVRCYKLNDQPVLGQALRLDHLNPYFIGIGLPFENVVLQKPQELCVPVYKNGVQPSPTSLPFVRYVDWKCYGIAGPSLDLGIHLDHLNPQIPPLLGPSVDGTIREPQQLCVPVRKNNQFIPAAVLNLIQWLDVKCYRFEAQQNANNQLITLNHLNPLYAGMAAQVATLLPAPNPTQLCVPVKKNLVAPPPAILNIAQYVDVLCYRIQAPALNQGVMLTHQNPVLAGLPVENVFAGVSTKLCVPVAKNGFFPPG